MRASRNVLLLSRESGLPRNNNNNNNNIFKNNNNNND